MEKAVSMLNMVSPAGPWGQRPPGHVVRSGNQCARSKVEVWTLAEPDQDLALGTNLRSANRPAGWVKADDGPIPLRKGA